MTEEQERMLRLTKNEYMDLKRRLNLGSGGLIYWGEWEQLELAPPKNWRPCCYDTCCNGKYPQIKSEMHEEPIVFYDGCRICPYVTEDGFKFVEAEIKKDREKK